MDHIKVVGYYKEEKEGHENTMQELLYFIAYENSYNDQVKERNWLECYNVIEGHFMIRDKNYLNVCKEIPKDEYIEVTKNYKTPKVYL